MDAARGVPLASGEQGTLYDRVGGDAGVDALIVVFYRRVFADPELSPFFEGVPRDRLRTMQHEFFSAALDGPVAYGGRPLREVHAGLGIQLRHLSRFLGHLMETLSEHSITEADRYEIYSRINTYADEITGSTPIGG
jgi:hemoglobin